MSHRKALSQWERTVSRHLPHLSRPQAHVLALWSYGMVLAKSCGITSVAALLADLLGSSMSTLRQQLREWCYDAQDKKGEHRQEVDVTLCFAPLLCWIVSWWPQTECRLALAMDATTLSDRFTVLCISVVYRRCAIPVAWKLMRGGEKGSWEPYWKTLFHTLQGSVPKHWTVIVMADRGLYAPWLFRHIVALGWHPFLRINLGGKVRPVGAEKFDWLSKLVPTTGSAWCGMVDCFVQSTVRCTLLARWDEGYADAWLVLTDLAPEAANVVWYSMRTWIEGGFKDTKRGGWQWHQTKMTDPARASRLWLAIAVATLWVVSVGGEAEATEPCSGLEALPDLHIARRTATKRSRARLQSCFAESGCDAFWWPCWTEGNCRWDASFRNPGRRRCRLARSPRRRKSYRQPPHHPKEFLRLRRRLHDKKPTRESVGAWAGDSDKRRDDRVGVCQSSTGSGQDGQDNQKYCEGCYHPHMLQVNH